MSAGGISIFQPIGTAAALRAPRGERRCPKVETHGSSFRLTLFRISADKSSERSGIALAPSGESLHTIAICDTEPIVIEGLLRLVEPVEGLRVVAAESTILDGMDAVRELRPSVLIVDKAFGLQAVMDWLVALRRDFRSMPVMVWGSSVTEPEVLRLIQAGVAGVVRKSAPLASILSCIQAVMSGGTWMEAPLQMEFGRPVGPGHSPLTARELQVLELVERGYKNKDIAVSLGIRIGTVKIHVKHIFEKTGVRGRFGLAISGMRQRTHSIGMATN